ncbi:MAG: glycosyltransferase family 2 protein [Candidatus Heimdallarchaeota archaeon]|nr:glycosyltransferase family 2 protein [Candidatus Heimdallarchaeota archaeon]MCK4954029.1 glycosyltransferase family 2 protein [Candidatus Heimdallarchaeota archaeon]
MTSEMLLDTMISVIIPVLNEEENVIPLYNELKGILTSMNKEYEIIFVDDGSTDQTLSQLLSLISNNEKNLWIVQFRRCFGQSAALLAGFHSAKSNLIITLDGDGQDDPQDIPSLLAALTEDVDVVCGWRYNRQDSYLFKKLPSRFFNYLNRIFNKLNIHDSGCTFRVYRKEAVSDILLLGGDHRHLPAILSNRGFRFSEVKVNHRPRSQGKSKYGFKRIFDGLSDLFTFRFLFNYGQRPMRLFSKIGILSLLTSLGLGIYLLVIKFAYGQDIGTRPLLLLTILLGIAGFQFLFTGFLAELTVRQNITVSSLYSIKKIYGLEEETNE